VNAFTQSGMNKRNISIVLIARLVLMDKDANPLPRNKSALGIQLLSNLYTLLQLDFTKERWEPFLGFPL
jgi:hypothetical protein